MSTTLDFFIANFALESQQSEECINGYQNLLTQFPNSNYINCQIALAYYQALGLFFKFKENIEINFYFINLQKKKKDYDTSETIFQKLWKKDKFRLDNMDVYRFFFFDNFNLYIVSFNYCD